MAKLTDLFRPFLSRLINTTAPLTGGGDLLSDRTISIPAATDAVNGYLTAADHATFAAKQAALGFTPPPNTRAINTSAPITGGGALSADLTIAIAAADGSTNGYLSSSNWTTFNSKVGTARAINTTAPVTGGGDLSADRTIAMHVADATHDGYLSSANWSTFNGYGALISTNTSDITTLNGSVSSLSSFLGSLTGTVSSLSGLVATAVQQATSISTTAPLTGGGDLSTNRTFGIPRADAATNGYLHKDDFASFAGLVGAVPTSRNINTTTPITGGGDLSADRTLAMAAATSLVPGYLTAADWATFNGKQATLVAADGTHDGYLTQGNWTTFNGKVGTARTINTTAPITGGGDLSADRTFAIAAADGSTNGYLTSTNWTTFNNKVGTARTINTTAPITGGGDLSADRTFAMAAATGSVPGYLTAADWTTFNGKQATLVAADASHNGYLTSTDWSTFNNKFGASGGTFTSDVTFNSRILVDKWTNNQSALTYAGTTDIDFDGLSAKTLSLTGNVTFTTSNKAAGRLKKIKILCDGTLRTFTFPAGWIFIGGAAPASIAISKTAILTLECWGTADTDIIAAYAVQS